MRYVGVSGRKSMFNRQAYIVAKDGYPLELHEWKITYYEDKGASIIKALIDWDDPDWRKYEEWMGKYPLLYAEVNDGTREGEAIQVEKLQLFSIGPWLSGGPSARNPRTMIFIGGTVKPVIPVDGSIPKPDRTKPIVPKK